MKKLIFAMPLLFCTLTSAMQEQYAEFLQKSSILKEFYRKNIITHIYTYPAGEWRVAFDAGFTHDHSLVMINMVDSIEGDKGMDETFRDAKRVYRWNYKIDFKGQSERKLYGKFDELPTLHKSFMSSDEVKHINTSYGLAIPLRPSHEVQGRENKLLITGKENDHYTVTLYDVTAACATKERCEREMSLPQIRLLSAIETAKNKFMSLALTGEEQGIFDQFPSTLRDIVQSNVLPQIKIHEEE
jgi:hypothetical protein